MPDTIPPPPATWRHQSDYRHPRLVDRLRTLWRLATTDDQRHHLEMLLEDVEDDARDWFHG